MSIRGACSRPLPNSGGAGCVGYQGIAARPRDYSRPHGRVWPPGPRDHLPAHRDRRGALPGRERAFALLCLLPPQFLPAYVEQDDGTGFAPAILRRRHRALGTPDDEVTTTVNVRRYVALKKESLERHRTQIERDGPFSKLPEDFMEEICPASFFNCPRFRNPAPAMFWPSCLPISRPYF